MVPSPFRYFVFATLLILVSIQLSNGAENYFQTCSNSSLNSLCGLHNLSYPFWWDNDWGSDRPEVCGQKEFKLKCWKDKPAYPRINIGGDYYNLVSLRSINTSTRTMNVSQQTNTTCDLLENNQTFDVSQSFKLGSNVANLTLFYGCPFNLASRYRFKSFACFKTSIPVTVYYFDYKPLPEIGKRNNYSCKGTITVPVHKAALDKLNNESNADFSLESALEYPFEVEYSTENLTACSTCQNSGGICGSSGDPAWSFVCYCPDGSQSSPCSISEKRKLRITLWLGIPAGTIMLMALAAFWYCKKLKSGRSKFVSRSDSLTSDLEHDSKCFSVPLFSYRELEEATDNFHQSRELGNGGFGIVYYGTLRDGREVAVKRLYEKSYRRVKQFMNEVQILTCLRHQNLVSLFGCTSPNCRELLLVYEYVPNGTVADHLYGNKSLCGSLPWPARMRVAIETASALSYLHASEIIHRDVKTNNILLDRSFGVKVADFGLSRLFPYDVTHVSTAPQGTPGYLDPEYHQCYQLTVKSDVYSFGVVLVELISSLPAVDMNRIRNEINLSNYAMNRIQRCAFDKLVDPQLGFEWDFKVRKMTISVAELAFQCLQHNREFRPSMNEVWEVLKRIESADYEALQAAEEAKNDRAVETIKPPPSPTEDDKATLLSTLQQLPQSPLSVIDTWSSRSTTSSMGKQGVNPCTI